MTDISPTYYDGNVIPREYVLSGRNFRYVENEALGVAATSNANPTERKDSTNNIVLYDIVEKTDSRLVLKQKEETAIGHANFLGCLVSADRQVVYWVNETEPLP